MFSILCSISCIAILSLQPRVDAFLVQSPFLPITTSQPWRDSRMTPIVAKPELRHLQPSFAKPIGTVAEGFQTSLGKVWSTVFGLLLPFREATVPLVALALSNEWQINLVKHVLTLISIRFVFSTIGDYKRQTSFQWRRVPRYLLASGLIALGGVWLDSLEVIPYYGINLLKHIATMYVCTQAARLVQFRRKNTEPSSLTVKRDRTAIKSKSPPQPVPRPPAPAPPRPSPSPPPTVVKEKVVAVAVTEKVDKASEKEEESTPVNDEPPSVDEQPKDEQITLEVNEKETDESNDESEKKENIMDDSLKEWLYSLANIQEELAEIQLKVIPEIFSKETYERTQERITKFQMGKIMDFFADDDD